MTVIDEFEMGNGRKTDISRDVEEKLAEMGFPWDKEELKTLVQDYITTRWQRYPRFFLKKPEHLQKARKSARDPFVVYDFFDQVSDIYLTTSSSPELIFNADETGFAS